MAVTVVESLEAVSIDHKKCDRVPGTDRPRDFRLQRLTEMPPVRDIGKAVGQRQTLQCGRHRVQGVAEQAQLADRHSGKIGPRTKLALAEAACDAGQQPHRPDDAAFRQPGGSRHGGEHSEEREAQRNQKMRVRVMRDAFPVDADGQDSTWMRRAGADGLHRGVTVNAGFSIRPRAIDDTAERIAAEGEQSGVGGSC